MEPYSTYFNMEAAVSTVAQSTYPTIVHEAGRIPWKNVGIWTVQGLLAVVFVFAGVAKLLMPIDVLSTQTGLPGFFMRFIAVCEITGALGLVLPGRFGISRILTPVAAACLCVIMIGAVSLTAAKQGIAPALFPLAVGCLLIVVIRTRWERS